MGLYIKCVSKGLQMYAYTSTWVAAIGRHKEIRLQLSKLVRLLPCRVPNRDRLCPLLGTSFQALINYQELVLLVHTHTHIYIYTYVSNFKRHSPHKKYYVQQM
jgi:hypothetical protein